MLDEFGIMAGRILCLFLRSIFRLLEVLEAGRIREAAVSGSGGASIALNFMLKADEVGRVSPSSCSCC